MVVCEHCQSDDIDLGEDLEDGRKRLVCTTCGHSWVRGESKPPQPKVLDHLSIARQAFSRAEEPDADRLERVTGLKREYLTRFPEQDGEVAPYWARYQQVFSQDGLTSCDPKDLKDFANTNIGANPGNMSGFNRAWNEMGAEVAAARTRSAIDYLLRGPEARTIEDRLTDLIAGDRHPGMPGFKESLLTKVLCIVQPDRFLPILIYTSPVAAGKREIAWSVFGVELPAPDKTSMTIGRLVFWSNDLLVRLAGGGFVSMAHLSEFLWLSRDRREGA